MPEVPNIALAPISCGTRRVGRKAAVMSSTSKPKRNCVNSWTLRVHTPVKNPAIGSGTMPDDSCLLIGDHCIVPAWPYCGRSPMAFQTAKQGSRTKFLTLSCVKSLLREKAPSWTAHSWIGQPSIFIPIFCNAFTRPPEKWPSRRGSARIRPAEEKAKSTGLRRLGTRGPSLRLCPSLAGREPLSSFSVQPEAEGCQTVACFGR